MKTIFAAGLALCACTTNGALSTGQATQGLTEGWSESGGTTSTTDFVDIGPIPSGGDYQSLTVHGPSAEYVPVTDDMDGEVHILTMTGDNRSPGQDAFGFVVRNQVNFNGGNATGGVYAEVTGHNTGSGTLIGMAFEAEAYNCDQCFSFYSAHGKFRIDDGGLFGPIAVVGTFDQGTGDVILNDGGGTTVVNGATTLQSTLTVVGTSEVGGYATFDSGLRVNGNANLDGGGTMAYLPALLNTSGHGAQFTDCVGVGGTGGPRWCSGASSPVGVVSCNIGDLYSNTSGSPSALYACTASNTWTAK